MRMEMFNGNVLRAKVVQGIIETMPCNHFFVTGTYHATAIGAQRYLQLPVMPNSFRPPLNFLARRFLLFRKTVESYV